MSVTPMSVTRVEFLVEEPSMEAFLRAVAPKLLRECSFEVYPHQCKDELLERLPQRLRGYAGWLPADWRIVVVVDRDDDDCAELRARLDAMVNEAGLRARTTRRRVDFQVATRIAVEELEAWHFGDWQAVLAAYPRAERARRGQASPSRRDSGRHVGSL